MASLTTVQIGALNKDSSIAEADQITAYADSIVSADGVAFGKKSSSGLSCVAIGYDAVATNYGVAIGLNAKADLGLAFGTDSDANSANNSMALGRYAKASAIGAVQLNGDKDDSGYKADNTEAYTLKFYAGAAHGNKTIVNANGKISADVAASCDGNAETATKLNVLSGSVSTAMQLSVVNDAPEEAEMQEGILYFVVENA